MRYNMSAVMKLIFHAIPAITYLFGTTVWANPPIPTFTPPAPFKVFFMSYARTIPCPANYLVNQVANGWLQNAGFTPNGNDSMVSGINALKRVVASIGVLPITNYESWVTLDVYADNSQWGQQVFNQLQGQISSYQIIDTCP